MQTRVSRGRAEALSACYRLRRALNAEAIVRDERREVGSTEAATAAVAKRAARKTAREPRSRGRPGEGCIANAPRTPNGERGESGVRRAQAGERSE